jgi:hypothetical protein
MDFGAIPDGTQMGAGFVVDGYMFISLGAPDPTVGSIGVEHGLRFGNSGIRVYLPAPATAINLDIGSWTGTQLDITFLDGNGGTVGMDTVPGDSSLHSLAFSGTGIMAIVITGGGNEGILVKICGEYE